MLVRYVSAYFLALGNTCSRDGLVGLAFFLPTIVNQLGFSPTRTQLVSVGPFAAGFVGSFHCSPLSLSLPSDNFESHADNLIPLGPLPPSRTLRIHRVHHRPRRLHHLPPLYLEINIIWLDVHERVWHLCVAAVIVGVDGEQLGTSL